MLNLKNSSDLMIGLATAPLLLGVLGGKVLSDILCELGQASEEIFRGDRLPILNLSTSVLDQASDTVSD
jgi:hypothetical protein